MPFDPENIPRECFGGALASEVSGGEITVASFLRIYPFMLDASQYINRELAVPQSLSGRKCVTQSVCVIILSQIHAEVSDTLQELHHW